MKFTVVIPSYNQEKYLPEAIESALDQTYDDFEVIVVNDGSTDKSLEIAKKYPVKVIDQVNKGLASARNTGIMNAKGDYVFFLDADDKLYPNCLERIATFNADIIAPSFKTFGTSDELVILMPNPTLEHFKTGNRIGYFSAVRKDILLEVGGYSPKMTWGYEDYHLWINLLTKGYKIATIPEPLVLYRTKEKSMWTESLNHHEELMSQIYKDFPNFQ